MKALVNYFLFVWMVAARGAWVSICCGGAADLVVCLQRRGFEGGTRRVWRSWRRLASSGPGRSWSKRPGWCGDAYPRDQQEPEP